MKRPASRHGVKQRPAAKKPAAAEAAPPSPSVFAESDVEGDGGPPLPVLKFWKHVRAH